MNTPLPKRSQVGAALARVLGRADLLAPTGATASAPEAPALVQAQLVVNDWHALLDAVKHRLRLCVHAPPRDHDVPPNGTCIDNTRINVLECVAALDQLHAGVRQELGRRQQLELEVFDLQAALAQARTELAGMRAVERHARRLATHDALTSLPNRSLFRERLDHALGLEHPEHVEVAVLFIDLDDFKPINDTHGHAVGDEVLRIVAMRLKHAVRSDDVVSRLGGDEFACLVADRLDRQQLKRLACKLFDAVAAPVAVGELRLSVTPSIGIAMQIGAHTQPDLLLQRADAAMYRAKRDRSGVAFCDCDATRLDA